MLPSRNVPLPHQCCFQSIYCMKDQLRTYHKANAAGWEPSCNWGKRQPPWPLGKLWAHRPCGVLTYFLWREGSWGKFQGYSVKHRGKEKTNHKTPNHQPKKLRPSFICSIERAPNKMLCWMAFKPTHPALFLKEGKQSCLTSYFFPKLCYSCCVLWLAPTLYFVITTRLPLHFPAMALKTN